MKFIHFGCWNNGTCSVDGTNGMSLTMRKLNSYLEFNPVEFIVLAGDNYYPQKSIMGKNFNTLNFYSGFCCLPQKVKKYLIFGNHDLEDVIINEDEEEIECKLLDEQIKITEGNDTIEIFNDVIYKIIDNTLVIMLDTNLYDRELINIPISKSCYSKLFNKFINKSDLTIRELIGYQNCFIIDVIKTYPTVVNVILIGHHPIYSIKNKKGQKNENKLPRFIDFLKQIKNLLISKNIYYLCADTHLYQSGIINIAPDFSIMQHIVGTGGAEQDNIYLEDDYIKENDKIVYVKTNEQKEFGFLEVEIIDSTVNFNFISANSTTESIKSIGLDQVHNKKYKKYKIIKQM
jgi:hypothetical protein